MSLDDVLGAAAEGLRQSVVHLQPDDDRPPPRRTGRAIVAGVAVVAVLAGGAYVLTRSGRTAAVRVTTRPGGLPHLVPGVVPPGLQVTGASDQAGMGSFSVHIRLYGSGSSADPMARGDVGVMSASVPSGQGSPGGPTTSAIVVNGHPAAFQTVGGVRLLVWNTSAQSGMSVASRTVPDSGLLAVARGVVVDGKGDGRATRGLPSGDRLVAAFGGSPVLPTQDLAAISGSAVVVAYAPARAGAGHAGYLGVATASGGPEQLVWERWWAGGATDVTVRGHAAILTGNSQGIINVIWQEAPGEVVAVMADGLAREQVLASAASLRPVDEAAWQALQQEAQRNQATSQLQPGEEIVARGSQQGVGFVITVRDAGTASQGFCTSQVQGTSGTTECAKQEIPTSATTPTTTPSVLSAHTGSSPPFAYLYGNVAKSVARVQLQFADGAAQDVSIVAGRDSDVYGAVVDRAKLPVEVVALDRQGRKVASEPLLFRL